MAAASPAAASCPPPPQREAPEALRVVATLGDADLARDTEGIDVSPDGQLCFVDSANKVFVYSTATGARQMDFGDVSDIVASMSSSGRVVALRYAGGDFGFSIMALNPSGSDVINGDEYNEGWMPVVSPDGTYVAYLYSEPTNHAVENPLCIVVDRIPSDDQAAGTHHDQNRRVHSWNIPEHVTVPSMSWGSSDTLYAVYCYPDGISRVEYNIRASQEQAQATHVPLRGLLSHVLQYNADWQMAPDGSSVACFCWIDENQSTGYGVWTYTPSSSKDGGEAGEMAFRRFIPVSLEIEGRDYTTSTSLVFANATTAMTTVSNRGIDRWDLNDPRQREPKPIWRIPDTAPDASYMINMSADGHVAVAGSKQHILVLREFDAHLMSKKAWS